MPYNSAGVYTPPAGATDAASGDVIHSATWNTIFSDLATALTSLGENSYINANRYVSSGSFTVTATDAVVVVQGSSPTITVPLASTRTGGFWLISGSSTIFGNA